MNTFATRIPGGQGVVSGWGGLGVRMLGAALLGGVAMAVWVPGGAAQAQDIMLAEGQRFLTASANAYGNTVPDIATFSVGVTAQDPTASGALDAMGASVTAVLETLAEIGIAQTDVRTENVSLFQDTEYQSFGPTVLGDFTASSDLSIVVRDLDRLGAVMDRVVDGGANRVYGLTFTVSDREAVLDEARVAAVAEATRRAGVIAAAAGVTLGPVVAITDYTFAPDEGVPLEQAARDVPIANGTVRLQTGVSMTFEIVQ